MFYVYILKDKENKLYVGYTNNLKRRLLEHKNNKTYTTKRMEGFKLVYYEVYLDKDSAQEREKKLKQHGSSFQGLIKRLK